MNPERISSSGAGNHSMWIGMGAVLGVLVIEDTLCALYYNSVFIGTRIGFFALVPIGTLLVISAPILMAIRRVRPSGLVPTALFATGLIAIAAQIPVLLTLLLYWAGHMG